MRADIEKGLTGGVEDVTAGVQITPARGTASASPAMSPAAVSPGVTAAGAELSAFNQMSMAPPVRVEAPPVTTNVNLTVDGEVLARATARAERSAAARSFAPLPAPG